MFYFSYSGREFKSFFCLARKALETALQEDGDSDSDGDDKFLNLEDNEGMIVIVFFSVFTDA